MGEHVGRVLLVPPSRDGWDAITAPVPCIATAFHTQAHGDPYYDVDSPYLKEMSPELAIKLGWRWHWPAVVFSGGRDMRSLSLPS